ncbi:hypothetical protein KEM60_01457 [Austwickia sp. TVS 96-490-7B]|uniref:CDP-alcohol phosphatidyltransferase family protein n=1 Tax=Austwickia sp. TVS 96-490-7B TaxID=2830843 RepID=UPI001C590C67|nr:CDP-alcohol phosphatidyltransferase family protein [Austwickia sp. TVS 96-490-7B]MBW3085260.1 hypothetical protein [Austwickia sp. TVS 96-490-7B]
MPTASPVRPSYRDNLALLTSRQKRGYTVAAYSHYINRPMGRRLAAAAAVLEMTPNQVTAISMIASYAGMALLCLVAPSPLVGVGVGVCLIAGYALDSADGQLARLQGSAGPAGEWLDHVSDQARTVSLHLAVLIWLWRYVDVPAWAFLLPMLWTVVLSTRFFGQILAGQLQLKRAGGVEAAAAIGGASRHQILLLPMDNGVICLAFVLVGAPALFLWVYGALLAANTVSTVASLRRRHRELAMGG